MAHIGTIKGKVKPIADQVFITDMEFDSVKTQTGIIIPSQNGKVTGIKPRWGKVYAVGPEQNDVKIGEWIYVDHGRWTRGFTLEDENGQEITLRRVDTKDILISADNPPQDVYLPE
jgi:co-chaperonin GroES (HSP10)